MLSFKQAIISIKKDNKNISEKKLINQMLKSMRSGELNFEIGNGKSIDDFYGWCKHHVDKNIDGTHPLNWMNLALYSELNIHLKDAPGLNPMIESVKKVLVNKSFEFVILPALLFDEEKEELMKNKILYTTTYGKLINDKKNNYFKMKTKKGNILLKFCWIIKEINLND